VDREGVKVFLRHEIKLWTSIRDAAAMVLADSGPVLIAKGMAILGQLDKNNVTYLVQRFADFNNAQFHTQVFQGDETSRAEGLKYYFEYVGRMSEELLAILKKSARSF